MEDKRTGLCHDYTRKEGVEHEQIYAPEGAPIWAQFRGSLWNEVEAKENRKNSCTAHEWEIGFLAEFTHAQRLEVGDKIARAIMERYHCAVDIAYHAPSKDGDQRNYHAHIMFTTRGFDASSKDGWAKGKIAQRRHDAMTVDGEKTTKGKEEIKRFRALIAQEMNHVAQRDGIKARIEHRSFAERGIDREPEPKLGQTASQMEKQGKPSIIGDELREVWTRNAEKAIEEERIDILSLAIEKETAQPLIKQRSSVEMLYTLQRRKYEKEAKEQQERIALLTAQLAGKSRLHVLWEKLRGRIGWTAEKELATARMVAQENIERMRALQLSQTIQRNKERESIPEPSKPLHQRPDDIFSTQRMKQARDAAMKQAAPIQNKPKERSKEHDHRPEPPRPRMR